MTRSGWTRGMTSTPTIPGYAIAYLRDVDLGPAIIDYIERIDATLAPFGGRFLVHGGPVHGVEGAWPGDVVIIAFPSPEEAKAWYESPAYQEILPLRTEHSDSIAAVLSGVPAGYRAVDKLATLLA
jgi:uncharacterized protein (DUF1330 family)